MAKWEYKIIYKNFAGEIENDLNKLGNEGWELCSIAESLGYLFYFKRKIED